MGRRSLNLAARPPVLTKDGPVVVSFMIGGQAAELCSFVSSNRGWPASSQRWRVRASGPDLREKLLTAENED